MWNRAWAWVARGLRGGWEVGNCVPGRGVGGAFLRPRSAEGGMVVRQGWGWGRQRGM